MSVKIKATGDLQLNDSHVWYVMAAVRDNKNGDGNHDGNRDGDDDDDDDDDDDEKDKDDDMMNPATTIFMTSNIHRYTT